MSVTALPARPPTRAPAPQPPTVTVTIDIALGAEGLSPPARHLLALVRDLVDTGGGSGADDAGAGAGAPEARSDPDTARRAGRVAGGGPGRDAVRLTRLEYDLLLFLARAPAPGVHPHPVAATRVGLRARM